MHRLGQVCVSFCSLHVFTNEYTFNYTSTGPRTHPRFKSESVGRFTTHEPHPRYKCESVGFSSIIQHTDPPSLQTRVGGPFSHKKSPPYPTLAPNASRWGFFLHYTYTDPPSLQTRVGGPFSHKNTPRTPPSLQTRVGGVLYCIIHADEAQTHVVWASKYLLVIKYVNFGPNARRLGLSSFFSYKFIFLV